MPIPARDAQQASKPSTSRPDLVLFTFGFPYDDQESVLGPELQITADCYQRIFIVPRRIGARLTSTLPPNARVVALDWSQDWSRQEKIRALVCRGTLKVLASTFSRASNWRTYLAGFRSYLDILAQGLLKAEVLGAWVAEQALEDAIFYDYWFENATLSLALMRDQQQVGVAVSRAHRFDIFDWAWTEVDKVPFRDYKASRLDGIFAVSDDGATYLRDRLRQSVRRRVCVSRLGVPLGWPMPELSDRPPLLVSCSTLSSRKQVQLLPQVLGALGRPIRWVHFGDGPERAAIERAAASLPPEVEWEIRGSVDNSVVLDFYRATAVAAFVSTSNSEGIPVSMMEAQSFGIPIVAFAVGGIPELVSEKVGTLLPPGSPVSDLTAAICDAITPGRFDRLEIREAFARRFEATTAFGSFSRSLLRLHSARSELAHDELAVTVTTVLYNSEASLPQYAEAIAPAVQSGAIRLIAVDNASPDRSAAAVRNLLPDVFVLANESNLGFAAGCNRAWPEVRTRFWLLLNPDVVATAADVATLVKWMDDRPGVGVASPRLQRADGTPVSVARPHDSLWRPVLELLRLHKLVPEPWRSTLLLSGRRRTPDEFRGWVPGAALIARAQAVDSVGLLDESLFMYGEDREWCWRMLQAGWAVGVCDDVTLVHAGGTSAIATWTNDERIAREVAGHLNASRKMRGRRFTLAFAAINAAVLWIESCDPRRDAGYRGELRKRGKAYLRGALHPDQPHLRP